MLALSIFSFVWLWFAVAVDLVHLTQEDRLRHRFGSFPECLGAGDATSNECADVFLDDE